MRKFCYKCKRCGNRWTDTTPALIYCVECDQYDCVVRDYKAEAVGMDMSNLRSARG
jgi:hypothetical protein